MLRRSWIDWRIKVRVIFWCSMSSIRGGFPFIIFWERSWPGKGLIRTISCVAFGWWRGSWKRISLDWRSKDKTTHVGILSTINFRRQIRKGGFRSVHMLVRFLNLFCKILVWFPQYESPSLTIWRVICFFSHGMGSTQSHAPHVTLSISFDERFRTT